MTDEERGNNKAKEISREFKQDPSIENYLRLRRENPSEIIEVSTIGFVDDLFAMQEELEANGISPNLVAAIYDSYPRAISELSLLLLAKIADSKRIRSDGDSTAVSRGKTISLSLVDWLVTSMLDAMSWNNELLIPRDLIVLIKDRLGGYKAEREHQARVRQMKTRASLLAGKMKAMGLNSSYRKLAEAFGISQTTVMRWYKEGEFEAERDRWALHYDDEGNFSMAPRGAKLKSNKDE